MPGLVLHNRRWTIGSDDLILPAGILAIFHMVTSTLHSTRCSIGAHCRCGERCCCRCWSWSPVCPLRTGPPSTCRGSWPPPSASPPPPSPSSLPLSWYCSTTDCWPSLLVTHSATLCGQCGICLSIYQCHTSHSLIPSTATLMHCAIRYRYEAQ